MSEREIAKLLPVKIKKKPNRLISQGSFKKRQKELENKLKEKAAAKREELKRRESKSPVKRLNGYKNFIKDRFNLGRIKKVEMVDAWTQTSNPDEKAEDPNLNDDTNSFMTHQSLKSTSWIPSYEDSKISTYKSNDQGSKMRVRVNSTI